MHEPFSMVRITHPFASGSMATQTEGVSVLSGVRTSRKLARNSTGKKNASDWTNDGVAVGFEGFGAPL